MVKKILLSVLFVFPAICAFADIWLDPVITSTFSQNKEYMLKVYPTKYPDNYFSFKYQRKYKKGIIKDTVNPCHAILYQIFNSDTIEIWNKPLVNFLSPVRVIVANDGKSVVTFDDWGFRGGNHTVVIYGENGVLIQDFKLEDISAFSIEQYPRSISSIFWGYGEYLDNDRVEIYFKNEYGEEKQKIFNIKKRVFE